MNSSKLLKFAILNLFILSWMPLVLQGDNIDDEKKTVIETKLQKFLSKLNFNFGNKNINLSYSDTTIGKFKDKKAIQCQWENHNKDRCTAVITSDSLEIAKFDVYYSENIPITENKPEIALTKNICRKILSDITPHRMRGYLKKEISVSDFPMGEGKGKRFAWPFYIDDIPYYSEYGVPSILINDKKKIIKVNIPPIPKKIEISNQRKQTSEEVSNIALKNGMAKYLIRCKTKNTRLVIKDLPVSQILNIRKTEKEVKSYYIWKVWLEPSPNEKQDTKGIYLLKYEIDAETGKIISSNSYKNYSKKNEAEIKRLEGLSQEQFWLEVQKAKEENNRQRKDGASTNN